MGRMNAKWLELSFHASSDAHLALGFGTSCRRRPPAQPLAPFSRSNLRKRACLPDWYSDSELSTFFVSRLSRKTLLHLRPTMQLNEALLCASAPTTSALGPGVLSLHDVQTGTALASWKQTSSATHCVATVQTRDGEGGFMLAAQQDKSILNVYTFQKVCVLSPIPSRCTSTQSVLVGSTRAQDRLTRKTHCHSC